MGKIIHVELSADDVARATAFYSKAFGWGCTSSPFVDGYEIADTGEGAGIDAAIMKREYQSQPAIAWIEVEDIDVAIAGVRRAGGLIASDKNTVPGEGHMIYVRDTEGNLLGLKQPL